MVTINIEHRHCLQSSATVALLLIAAISCDFIRGYSLVGTSERINLLAILTTSVLKIALLLLNEVRKNSLIKDDYLRQNTKTLGGFITRSFSSGLFYIVSVGYSSVLGVARNTMKLDGQFVSKPLLQKFTDLWAHRMSPCLTQVLDSCSNIYRKRSTTSATPCRLYSYICLAILVDCSCSTRVFTTIPFTASSHPLYCTLCCRDIPTR